MTDGRLHFSLGGTATLLTAPDPSGRGHRVEGEDGNRVKVFLQVIILVIMDEDLVLIGGAAPWSVGAFSAGHAHQGQLTVRGMAKAQIPTHKEGLIHLYHCTDE